MMKKKLYLSISFIVVIIVALIVALNNNTRINDINIANQLAGNYGYIIYFQALEDEDGNLIDTKCHGPNSFEATIVCSTNYPKMNHIEFDLDFDGTIHSVTPTSGWVTTYNPNGTEYSFTSNTIYETDGINTLNVEVGKICFTLSGDSTYTPKNRYVSLENTNTLNISNIAVANSGDTNDLSKVEYNSKFYYKINLTSDSVITTDNVTLTANIPEGLIIRDTDGGTKNGRNITWNVGPMAVDATKTYIVEVQVDSNNMHNYNTTALEESITVQVGSNNPINKPKSVSIVYPKLTANITASKSSVKRGATFDYDVTINNSGAKAYNVNVTDNLPNGVKLADSSETTYTTNYATINSNESKTFTISVKADDNATLGLLDNTINITSSNYKNTSATSTVNIVDSNLSYSINQDKMTARIGDTVTWTINVNNTGEAPSESIQLISVIPSKMETVSLDGAASYGNTITWYNSAISSGGTTTRTLVTKIKQSVNVGDTVTVPFTLKESGKADQALSKSVTVKDSIMSLTNTTTKTIFKPGETFDYTLSINNTGEVESRNIVVEDTIDSRLQIVSAGNATINGNKVTWNAGVVASNASKDLTVKVKSKDVGSDTVLTSTAVLKELNRPDIASDNSITIKKPTGVISYKYYNIDMDKELNMVSAGEEFIYQIALKNTSEVVGNNITLSATIDSNLTIIDAGDGVKNGNTITWSISVIDTNQLITKNIRVKVKENVDNGTNIKNTMSASGDGISLSSNNNITVVEGNIYAIQTASKDQIKAGDDITYKVKVGNRGTSTVNNITIVDTLPSEFILSSINYPQESAILDSSTNKITISQLAANSEITIDFIGKISNDVSENQNIINQIQLQYDNITINNSNTAVIVDSNVSISLQPSRIEVLNKEVFNWVVTIKNTGTGVATNLKITDNMPEEVEVISCDNCENNNNTLVWNISSLAVNETKTLLISARVDNQEIGTNITNSVLLEELGKNNKTSSSIIEITRYKVNISQKASVSKAESGDSFKYTITIKNIGNQAVNAKLVDYIDPSIEMVDYGNALFTNNTLVWDLQLAPNEEKVFVLNAKVKKDAGLEEATNKISLFIDEEEYKTNSDTISLIVNAVNPHTGNVINILFIITGIIISITLLMFTSKKKRFYKV